jgi:hypothetical protein
LQLFETALLALGFLQSYSVALGNKDWFEPGAGLVLGRGVLLVLALLGGDLEVFADSFVVGREELFFGALFRALF